MRGTALFNHVNYPHDFRKTQKKEGVLEPVNTALLRRVHPDDIAVDIQKVHEAEVDEIWSFVGSKKARAGSGTRSITALAVSWRTSLVAAKMRSLWS
jgi:hypothetical protein